MWDKWERQRFFRQFIDFQIDSFKEKQTQCLNRPVENLAYLYLLFHSEAETGLTGLDVYFCLFYYYLYLL